MTLAGFYYLKLHQKQAAINPSSPFSADVVHKPVLELKTQNALSRMTIQDRSKGTVISFERDGKDQWQITSPILFPAESLVVDGLVALLKLTPRIRSLDFSGLAAHDYGFDEPRLKICVALSNQKDKCLLIGNDSAIGKAAYAKWDSEDIYFLVEPIFLQSFDKTLYAVLKKQIFSFSEDEITSIHFETNKKEMNLFHENGHWVRQKPAESMMSRQAMENILTELGNLYIKEFLSEEETASLKIKWDRPVRKIQISFRDGSQQTLLQGKAASGKAAYYARLGHLENVFLVSAAKLDHLDKVFTTT